MSERKRYQSRKGYYQQYRIDNKEKLHQQSKERYRKNYVSKYTKGDKCPQRAPHNPFPIFEKFNKNEEFIKNRLRGLVKRPNNQERKLINIIVNHNLPYKYVGDGNFILGNKNPDFINCNGKKQVIELFGRYWHTGDRAHQSVEERVNEFKSYGFNCLIIWDDELCCPKHVLKKIENFEQQTKIY